MADGSISRPSPIFLLLSAEQARNFFANGRLRVTVIVPSSLNRAARPLLSSQNVFDKLSAFDTLNVHDYEVN